MFEYLSTLPEWLEASIWISLIAIALGSATAGIYRMVRYGIKARASIGPVSTEIDASEENEETK